MIYSAPEAFVERGAVPTDHRHARRRRPCHRPRVRATASPSTTASIWSKSATAFPYFEKSHETGRTDGPHRGRDRLRGAGEGPRARSAGPQHRSPGDRRARFPDARAHRRGGQDRRSTKAGRTTARRRAIPSCARRSRSMSARRAGSRSGRSTSASCPAASRSSSSRCSRCSKPGDEVIYPNPGFPIYESMIQLSRARRPCRCRCVEERGFSFDLDLFRERSSRTGRRW